jgi:hypothetical protein
MDDDPRFSLRELLVAVTLVAVAAACIRPYFTTDFRQAGVDEAAAVIFGWIGAGMAIGAAIGGLFFKNWLGGAATGLFAQFISLGLLTGAY